MNKNLKNIFFVYIIILGIVFAALLFGFAVGYFDRSDKTLYSCTMLAMPVAFGLILFTIGWGNKAYFLRRRLCKKKQLEDINILSKYIDKCVVVETFVKEFHGTLILVEGAWLKLIDRDQKNVSHIIKSEMITSIKVIGGK